MPRGVGRDKRETFSYDTVRLRNKAKGPHAPQKGTLELYFKEKILYKMEDNGVETPIGGFGASASPGFTWGKAGVVEAGEYLYNDGVPSSFTGRVVSFTRPTLRKILVNVSDDVVGTATFEVITHEGHTGGSGGVPFVLVNAAVEKEVSLVNESEQVVDINVPIDSGKQIAIRLKTGSVSCKNPVVGILLDGLY